MSRLSVNQGYSKKNRTIFNASRIHEPPNKDFIGLKTKLPPLNPDRFFVSKRAQSIIEYPRNPNTFTKDPLDSQIKDINQEYESAIRKHLNINFLPSGQEKEEEDDDDEHSPLVKIKANSPNRFHSRYSSKSVTDHYIELNHSTDTTKLSKDPKQTSKKPQLNSLIPISKPKSFKFPDSLESIRLLLTRLKN